MEISLQCFANPPPRPGSAHSAPAAVSAACSVAARQPFSGDGKGDGGETKGGSPVRQRGGNLRGKVVLPAGILAPDL